MSADAYSEDQLVEQPAIGRVSRMIPTGDSRWVLIKSLAAERRKPMFFRMFLFEWKTSE